MSGRADGQGESRGGFCWPCQAWLPVSIPSIAVTCLLPLPPVANSVCFICCFSRKQLAKPGSRQQRRSQLVKRDLKILVPKMKRLKDMYDGGGEEWRASCPRPMQNKVAARPRNTPVFSCKACYSSCDRGSKKHLTKKSKPHPTALGAPGGGVGVAERRGTTARGTKSF